MKGDKSRKQCENKKEYYQDLHIFFIEYEPQGLNVPILSPILLGKLLTLLIVIL